ncbi:heat shock 70 kDa protein 4 isoform X2 [Agrilus planipennis]|uniref:Heat shock 70 kDa protein 4 isoform X2 n=1 Tax=Agrilus planipennis TaxID=224129 RepID=A0A7F5R5B1_AGRPL|nr:heat shock 70 kDa protein 4 isoform X2 [Agrilus planipennis]
MAAMSVIGIDFGNESCYVAVAKAGGIETIANDYSLRATPSYVAFSGKNRILGVAAKNQQVTNMKNTVYGLKRLLGRKFRDPHVQNEIKHFPFTVIETNNGGIGIRVNYLGEEHIFSPEQCLAMLFTKLKETSATALQTQVNDCVISVPSYYTNNERKALLDAAAISGLNVLRLFNETTATALNYGIYKQDLPAPEEKPRNVIFVDWGHASLQVAACAFHKGKLRMLATAFDPYLGGRDIDLILADHFCKEFYQKYRVDATLNKRAFIRLLAEVEKLKKQMSANSTTLPLAIECFMEEKDVRSEMKRSDMETMCASLFQRVENTLRQCLESSGLKLEEIHSVEIVGGSTRIPAIKQLIEKIFHKSASTTLNQDEAVSRGCALQCAMLSPAVRVREFSVTDVQTYPITVLWDASAEGEASGEIEVFPVNHATPFSKMLTFYRREPFTLRAMYSGNLPYPDKNIGTWIVKDVHPSPDGKPQKVKVKVRVNIHGIMTISSASLIESKESVDTEEPEEQSQQQQQNQKKGEAEEKMPVDSSPGGGQTAPEEGEEKKEKKKKVKCIELPIESLTSGFSQVELNQYTEQEYKMIAADKQEKERADARNALEEYVYELRGKLSCEGELAPYVLETDGSKLISQLEDMENWLYEEGEDCNRQVYQDKLVDLKSKGEPIQQRRIEADLRPIVLDDYGRSIQLGNKVLEQIKSKDPKYGHITDDEAKKLEQGISQSFQWLDQARNQLNSTPKHVPPPITVNQIRQEHNNFDSLVHPIINKPAPKPAAPKEEKENKEAKEKHSNQEQTNQTQNAEQNAKENEEKMEWSAT